MFLTGQKQVFPAQPNDGIMMSIIWNLLLSALLGSPSQTGTITVVATTTETGQGKVHVALFRDAASFPKNEAACQGAEFPAAGASVRHTFQTVPFGTYAVAVFQDLNGNGKLDCNLFGIPNEPYAFSNNPVVKWQEPTFQEAAFLLDCPATSVRIQLKTWKHY
jgi:uncharacterized protein (DUF2141 family)